MSDIPRYMDEKEKQLAEELLFAEKKAPSFAKLFYFGIFKNELALPFPEASKEQREKTENLLKKLETFAKEKIDAKAIDQQKKIPDDVIEGLGKLGILGLTIPKEYGGLGLGQYAYCKVLEKLASICGSTALFVNAHQSVGLKALLLFGTKKQKEKWLVPLAKGEKIAAFSLTEPNAGSDAAGIETKAVYDPEKKVYRINGKKQWTTNGSIASVLTVMAKTEDGKVTAFLVTPDMKGFFIDEKALDKVGYRGTWTANLHFENLEVPEENILGPKGKGLKVCLTVLDYGRTTFGATCTGTAKYLVKRANEYVLSRYQFNKPLFHFPLVKEKIAKMNALVYAMDATTYLTAGLIDKKTEDIMLETAILKVFASQSLWDILYDTMQLFGGRSFFTDEPFERMMRDARINMIGEGSNDVLDVFIAVVGLRDVGVHLKEGVEAFKNPFKGYKKIYLFIKSLLKRFFKPKIFIESKLLKDEVKILEKDVKVFGLSILRLLGKYKEEVVDRQLELKRVANCAISLYTRAAVLSKADRETQNQEGIQKAKFYSLMAHRQFIEAQKHLMKNKDDEKMIAFSNNLLSSKEKRLDNE